jgi:hypothetical protein
MSGSVLRFDGWVVKFWYRYFRLGHGFLMLVRIVLCRKLNKFDL